MNAPAAVRMRTRCARWASIIELDTYGCVVLEYKWQGSSDGTSILWACQPAKIVCKTTCIDSITCTSGNHNSCAHVHGNVSQPHRHVWWIGQCSAQFRWSEAQKCELYDRGLSKNAVLTYYIYDSMYFLQRLWSRICANIKFKLIRSKHAINRPTRLSRQWITILEFHGNLFARLAISHQWWDRQRFSAGAVSLSFSLCLFLVMEGKSCLLCRHILTA